MRVVFAALLLTPNLAAQAQNVKEQVLLGHPAHVTTVAPTQRNRDKTDNVVMQTTKQEVA